ncbi:MAG: BMC domain-containing protein [Eubacteriales bacterium]|nr:BMC domain-containing protein [Eubacteriales bacterium]
MSYGAFGIVEVLGSANAVMAVDQMLKTSDVAFRAKNTKCGGHTTLFVSGDVAAVQAAIDSLKQNPPCEICMTAVISAPSEETVRMVEMNIKK